MEGLSRAPESAALWKQERLADDEVGPPRFDVPTAVPRVRVDVPERRVAQETRDYQEIVERQLALGRDPEEYFSQLSSVYDAYSARRRDIVASGATGAEAGREADVTRKMRYEMNALIPRVAKARVRADVPRFSTPEAYLAHLGRQLAHAEATAESAEGDEVALRSAIDVGRVLREQVSEAKRVAADADGWRRMRAEAFSRGRSSLDDVVLDIARPRALAQERGRLEAERASLRFWQFARKAELDARIGEIRVQEAREAKREEIERSRKAAESSVPRIGDMAERARALMRERSGDASDAALRRHRDMVRHAGDLLRMTMLEMGSPMPHDVRSRIEYAHRPAEVVPPEVRRTLDRARQSPDAVRRGWAEYGLGVLDVLRVLSAPVSRSEGRDRTIAG